MLAPVSDDLSARLATIFDSAAAGLGDTQPILAILTQDEHDPEQLRLATKSVDGSLFDAIGDCPVDGECVAVVVAYPVGASPFEEHTTTHPGHSRVTLTLAHEGGVVVYRYPDGATVSVPLNGRLLRRMRELWAIRLDGEARRAGPPPTSRSGGAAPGR